MGLHSRKLVMFAALALSAVTTATPASAASPRRGASVSLRVIGQSEAAILGSGTVRVRIAGRPRSLVRVYVVAAAGGGSANVVITRVRLVRVRGRGSIVTLPLIKAGRSVLRGCAATVDVRGVLLSGRRHRPARRLHSGRRLVGDAGRCHVSGGRLAASGRGSGPGGSGHDGGSTGSGHQKDSNPDQGTGSCDPIDPAVCLQPFPNDYFTVRDPTTDTGRRVSLNLTSMPRNKAGKPIDPSDINRNDGFGPGSPIVTKVPGMDNPKAFEQTGAVSLTDLARAYDADQPVVVINTRTLERQLIWAEVDSNPQDPANRNLVIHPAKNLDEDTRYIVALRDMRNDVGGLLAPSPTFRSYRDHVVTSDPAIEGRRAHFEALFDTLAAAGIGRENLYLAWDFTVASARSLSERQLSIRDDAFRQLGDNNLADLTVQGSPPTFAVDKVTNFSVAENDKIARRVEGSYTVPCYLNAPGCPSGSRFLYPPGSTHGPPLAIPGNTTTAYFTCNIPRVAMAGGGARPSLYGHGLFGSRDEVNQDQAQRMDQEHNFMYCATDWVGMACNVPGTPSDPAGGQAFLAQLVAETLAGHPPSTADCDVPTAIAAEGDLSNFPTLVDRVDQAFVNFMYLGRLMIHPSGFSSDPAFQRSPGASVIDTGRLYYDGNSQGGIFGGSLIALEPDLNRGVVGVPGMNYSVLLQRSSDFGTGASPPATNPTDIQFAYPLYQAYPNELERQLILSLIQQMWDHSDPSGLAAHMTDNPLPNTPAHHVLMHVGLGDHQVSQYAAQAEARTIGARARVPWADPGRYFETGDPTYGIAPITGYPYDGSAIVLWDIGPVRSSPCAPGESTCGTDPPPITNTPPSGGQDPHEYPRRSAAARQMKSDFLSPGGMVTNTCGSRPCYAGSWSGP
ncbi:MAG: hypothetical protein NVSMB25_17980 [Thermoleophilaceae bacterium]